MCSILFTFAKRRYREKLPCNSTSIGSRLYGFNGILFLQTGESKAQFQQIFFQSDDYFAGQIKLNYLRFMLRLPTSEEEVYYSSRLKSDGNIRNVLIDLLSSDEYAGI